MPPTLNDWQRYLVTQRRQQRRLEAEAHTTTDAWRGINWLRERSWLDRNRTAPTGRNWPTRRTMRHLSVEERIRLYERLDAGADVISYTGRDGKLAGALVYNNHPDRPGDRRLVRYSDQGRITGLH
jgi:hypothetical protein